MTGNLTERRKVTVKRLLIILLMTVIVGVLICSGCPKPTEGIPTEIRIGDTVSYTGAYASFGRGSFGVEAAVEDINAQGGIYVKEYDKKIPVKWITVDCESDPLKVAPLTEDLILRDKVQFLGMHLEVPTLRQGTAMMADKYKIPAVFGVGPLESWMEIRKSANAEWKYSWAFGFDMGTPFPAGDFREGNMGYQFVPTIFGALQSATAQTNKKMACFALDDADGRAWYMVFTGLSIQQGFDCYRAADQFGIYPGGTTDFSPLIQEWKDAGCEILWGNCPGPDFGTILRQCKAQGFEPKVVFATRAADYYADIEAWGGDLPNGVYMESWFVRNPKTINDRGIGDTTTESLAERWYQKTGEPYEGSGIGWEYMGAQILFNAIEKAGTLDSDAVLKAISETDFMSMDGGRVVFSDFDGTHFHCWPVAVGQWQKTDNPWVWEPKTVFSLNDVYLQTAEQIFPKPWD
jgi:branched-chain amino acid transport system substrate-binding protein